jgi:hypothetical protein
MTISAPTIIIHMPFELESITSGTQSLAVKTRKMHPLSSSPIMAAESVSSQHHLHVASLYEDDSDDRVDHPPTSDTWIQGESQEQQQPKRLGDDDQPAQPRRMDRMSLFQQHNWGKGRRSLIESSHDNDSIGHHNDIERTRIVDETTMMRVDAVTVLDKNTPSNGSTDCHGSSMTDKRRRRRSSKSHKQKQERKGEEDEDDEHRDMVSQEQTRCYYGKNLRDHFKTAMPDQSSTRTIQTSNLTAFTGDTDCDTIITNKQSGEPGKAYDRRPMERTMSKSPCASRTSRRELRKDSSPKMERRQSSKLKSHRSEALMDSFSGSGSRPS